MVILVRIYYSNVVNIFENDQRDFSLFRVRGREGRIFFIDIVRSLISNKKIKNWIGVEKS